MNKVGRSLDKNDFERNKLPRYQSPDSTQGALGPVLVFGQFFGILPVINVSGTRAHNLLFKWKSFRTIYSIYIIAMSTIFIGLSVNRFYKFGFSLSGVTVIWFYSSTTCFTIILLTQAVSWRTFMTKYEKMEEFFLQDPYRQVGRSLKFRLRFVAFSILTLCIIEHMLYYSTKLVNAIQQVDKCKFKVSYYEHFLRTERRHLFRVFPFSYFIAIPFEIVNSTNTIQWTFIDVFIISFSISMAYRFRQISDRIKRYQYETMSDDYWFEVRNHFTTLVELVNYVNNRFSNLILLSCGTNLYFTCFILFNSIGEIPEKLNALYFYVSLLFIIFRTLMVLYFAASVNDCSKRPFHLVQSVPYTGWGAEIERFTYQLSTEMVAVSGKQFFSITRTMILTLVGTVVTYELVLLDQITEAPEVIQQSCRVVYNITT